MKRNFKFHFSNMMIFSAVLLSAAICISCVKSQSKVLVVIADSSFDEMQYKIAAARLISSGFDITTVNFISDTAVGSRGMKQKTDMRIKDINTDDYISMLILGQHEILGHYKNDNLKAAINKFAVSGKPIGALGNSPAALAEAGILKNRKTSCWPEALTIVKASGADYSKEIISQDENILTGMGGSDENDTKYIIQYIDLISRVKDRRVFDNNNKKNINLKLDVENKRFIFSHNNRTRTGMYYIPESYDPLKKYSLLFVLHGSGGCGNDLFEKGFNSFAEKLDFIVVYPDGYNGDWDIIPERETNFDDLGYFKILIKQFKKDFNIDKKRIYFTGHSLGAFMSYRMAYDLPHEIAAIAPVSGLVYTPAGKKSGHYDVSILHQHSKDDFNVRFSKIDDLHVDPLPVYDSIDFWKNLNSINSSETNEAFAGGIVKRTWKNSVSEITLLEYSSGGHAWFANATEYIAEFFYNHPMRENKIVLKPDNLRSYYNEGSGIIIVAEPHKNENISRMNFYINGEMKHTDESYPYEYKLIDLKKGNYKITASAVLENKVEIHSVKSLTFFVTDADLARGMNVQVSSAENDSFDRQYLTDGSSYTRWGSLFADNQWIVVDLQKIREISGATLMWETAFASSYQIQVSGDGKKWRTVFVKENGKGGVEKISFHPVKAKFLRLNLIKRSTQWGFSLWDILIHGDENKIE